MDRIQLQVHMDRIQRQVQQPTLISTYTVHTTHFISQQPNGSQPSTTSVYQNLHPEQNSLVQPCSVFTTIMTPARQYLVFTHQQYILGATVGMPGLIYQAH